MPTIQISLYENIATTCLLQVDQLAHRNTKETSRTIQLISRSNPLLPFTCRAAPITMRSLPIYYCKGMPTRFHQSIFQRKGNLNELKGDLESAYYGDAELWGSLFWELRGKFTREKIDGLLVQAWFGLKENSSLDAQRRAFGNAIVGIVSQKLG